MDSYKSYTDRVLQPTPHIMGLKLLPFSLGHSMLLKAAKSKFICGTKSELKKLASKELIVELVFALLVCSTTYDEFKAELHNGTFKAEIDTYIKSISGVKLKKAKDFSLVLEAQKFAAYIIEGTTAPEYRLKNSDNNSVSTNPIEPEEAILSTLMSDCGYTRDNCLNLPLTETLSAYLLYAFKQGTIDLVSKEVFELEQRLKRGKK